MKAHNINSGEIRDIIVMDSLTKLVTSLEYGIKNKFAMEDSFSSIMFLGPPGVGKSSLQYLAIKDVARILSEKRKKNIEAVKISLRITHEEASNITNRVVKGDVIPYVHLYLPQMKPWQLEGTPSPMDNFIEINGKKLPYNLWRLDPFMIPLLDYTDIIKSPEQLNTPLLVIDEFNMGRKDVRETLFQLARSAELGKAKLSPLSIITLLGNTPETNIYAEELPSPLLNRATRYIVSQPSIDGWLAFMNEVYGKKWTQEVGGFLLISPKYLYYQDEVEKEILITPRTWTQLSIKLYTLKMLLSKKYNFIDKKDVYWKQTERIIYGFLTRDIASEFYGFLRGLSSINLLDVIKDPSKILQFDKNMISYLLIKITSYQIETYKKSPEKRNLILKNLVDMYNYAKQKIGNEALGIIISSLPEPVKIKYASMMPSNIKGELKNITKKVKEYEEYLGV